jgi:hypothetical protein
MANDTLSNIEGKFTDTHGTASAILSLMYEADAGSGVDALPAGTILKACIPGSAAVKKMHEAFYELAQLCTDSGKDKPTDAESQEVRT